MKYLVKFIPCLLFLGTLSAQAGTLRVGNGGFGVVANDQIFVLDLVEAGSHKSPYFAQPISSDLENLLQGSPLLRLQGLNPNLLLQKVTELDALLPGLGAMFIDSFRNFSLRLTDEPMLVISSQKGPRTPDGSAPVVLAVRRYRTIYFSESHWHRLDERQKIALIFHEGLYNFVPLAFSSDYSEQPNSKARALVGALFLEPSKRDADFSEKLATLLDVGELKALQKPLLHMTLWTSTASLSGVRIPDVPISIEVGTELDSLKDLALRTCQQIDEIQLSHSFVILDIKKTLPYINSFIYLTKYGTQVGFKVATRMDQSRKFIHFQNPPSVTTCQQKLLSRFL